MFTFMWKAENINSPSLIYSLYSDDKRFYPTFINPTRVIGTDCFRPDKSVFKVRTRYILLQKDTRISRGSLNTRRYTREMRDYLLSADNPFLSVPLPRDEGTADKQDSSRYGISIDRRDISNGILYRALKTPFILFELYLFACRCRPIIHRSVHTIKSNKVARDVNLPLHVKNAQRRDLNNTSLFFRLHNFIEFPSLPAARKLRCYPLHQVYQKYFGQIRRRYRVLMYIQRLRGRFILANDSSEP